MKKLLIALLTLLALPIEAQQNMELTAAEVATRMTPGWNLGNTLEAGDNSNNFKNSGTGTETWWQDTKTTKAVIDYVRAQGFRSIRIPCAWVMGHISNATDNTIDPAWMQRVKEIVDYSLEAGLYVVINQHWDGGWLENHIADTSGKAQRKEVLKSIWTQIATTFRDYDERLLFAGLNEPNAENQAATNNLVEYEQVFLNTVRDTGGNNARRVLIVQGPSTNIDHTCNYLTTLPTDPAEDRLMVEVHYYAPWNFWGMEHDESWGNVFYYWGSQNHVSGSSHNATYGEESYMEEQLQKMKTRFADRGIPVYIGEFGANWRKITGAAESQEKHNASIKYHYKVFMEKCFQKGIVPVVWDTNYRGQPSMTIIDRKNLTIYNNYMMDGIHEAMEEAGISTAILSPQSEVPAQESPAIYDLQGRVMAAVPDGAIYIRGGRKYVGR